jgi:hypothetical protein
MKMLSKDASEPSGLNGRSANGKEVRIDGNQILAIQLQRLCSQVINARKFALS